MSVCMPHAGADGSWVNMLQAGRGAGPTQSIVAEPVRPHPFHTDIKVSPAAVQCDAGDRGATHAALQVQRGVLEDQASAMLQQFFRQRRLQPKDPSFGQQ